jgi:hypothetical protein
MADNDNEPREEQKSPTPLMSSEYKNSRAIPWSDVPWHEFPLYVRDGKEVAALLEAGERFARKE